jgi:hypothetical protein
MWLLLLGFSFERSPRLYGIDVSDLADDRTKWGGAVTIGTTLYAVPRTAESFLVLETTTGEVRGLEVPGFEGPQKWNGAAAVNGTVYAFPCRADAILALDTATQRVWSIDVSSVAVGMFKLE